MSFNPSIGDLVLCTQIAYRVFSAVRDCKTTAPRDLKELEGVLRGLHIALEHLSSNISAIVNVVLSETIKDALQSMTSLCRQTLEELQDATRPYCNAAYDPVFPNGTAFTRKLPVRIKMHWKRFVWQMRGDSFTQYRNNLLLHTQSINVLVNTLNLYVKALSFVE
ncbi:uncharacterized protein N7529_005924 [Penicillium soppii]|uniref:uncharacterized protein n=1 Tax=Penicillium soppii TaxID=69789 RepID=UPI0025480A3D|nr:uncharacterized protein N7529_005924 [Penicillium soppii]KAJ5864008.1 hypothetical protein N7529_005924 [Penicillium soppii]